MKFTLSAPDNAMYQTLGNLYLSNGKNGIIPVNEGKTYTFSWQVDYGYDIEITNVTLNVVKASGAGSYITVGDGPRTGDLFSVITADLSTGSHVYTTNESFNIVFEKAFSWSTVALNSITVTYTLIPKFIYDGSGDGSDGDTEHLRWSKADNWLHNVVPTINDDVFIRHNVVVDDAAVARSMTIEGANTVTVAPSGDLKIGNGGVINATTSNLKLSAATDGANKGQTGSLRISPSFTGALPNATVELYSIAYFDMTADDRNNVGSYQYVGSPMVAGAAAKTIFPNSWCYNWDETTGAWKNNRKNLILQPFVGYATSQYTNPAGLLISHAGQLASNGNQVLPLTYTASSAEPGINVLANSYAAPIDITNLQASDFSTGVEATIHLFNTGSRNDVEAREGQPTDLSAAGQYISIPVNTAQYLIDYFGYPSVIPSMQGFYVQTTQTGTMTLNYERLVWNATYGNAPLRAPQRESEEMRSSLCLTLFADGWSDQLYLLESETNVAAFENGYDARKMMSGNLNVYSIESTDTLAVDVTNHIIGTRIGVRTGEETAYTFAFSHLRSTDDLALYDRETDQIVPINEGTQYTFFAEPNAVLADRFLIVEQGLSTVTTGLNNAAGEAAAHKFLREGQLYILKSGVLYDAMGRSLQR